MSERPIFFNGEIVNPDNVFKTGETVTVKEKLKNRDVIGADLDPTIVLHVNRRFLTPGGELVHFTWLDKDGNTRMGTLPAVHLNTTKGGAE